LGQTTEIGIAKNSGLRMAREGEPAGKCQIASFPRQETGGSVNYDDENEEESSGYGMSKESEAKTRVIHRHPPGKASPPASGEDQIHFQCPNGHRIVVVAALAGKRGKCSKCGVAVEIPRGEPALAVDQAEPQPILPETGELPAHIQGHQDSAAAPLAGTDSWDFIGDQSDLTEWPGADSPGGALVDGGHPTATLVARLWAERAHGGVIELHLANGSVILPEWYDANWSRGSHGLFASQAADGTVTLTAVAWETVQKVVVRKLTAVPDDMFAG
jgi:hypothetical protein